MAKDRKKLGRPYGRNYSGVVRVRLEPEVELALRRARRITGLRTSEMVRLGVSVLLASTGALAIDRVRSEKSSDRMRMVMIDYLRTLAKAGRAITKQGSTERQPVADDDSHDDSTLAQTTDGRARPKLRRRRTP